MYVATTFAYYHVLGPNEVASYEAVGREIAASGAELILVYSTQWFSVIGHLFQTDPAPKWILVDQNWYEFGEIPYEFRVDPAIGNINVQAGALSFEATTTLGNPASNLTVSAGATHHRAPPSSLAANNSKRRATPIPARPRSPAAPA